MEQEIKFEPAFEDMLQKGAPVHIVRDINSPILIPTSIILNSKLSRHLLGVYTTLLYMVDKNIGLEYITNFGIDEKRFYSNLEELIELGLITKNSDGSIRLEEVC